MTIKKQKDNQRPLWVDIANRIHSEPAFNFYKLLDGLKADYKLVKIKKK